MTRIREKITLARGTTNARMTDKLSRMHERWGAGFANPHLERYTEKPSATARAVVGFREEDWQALRRKTQTHRPDPRWIK